MKAWYVICMTIAASIHVYLWRVFETLVFVAGVRGVGKFLERRLVDREAYMERVRGPGKLKLALCIMREGCVIKPVCTGVCSSFETLWTRG